MGDQIGAVGKVKRRKIPAYLQKPANYLEKFDLKKLIGNSVWTAPVKYNGEYGRSAGGSNITGSYNK